VIELGRAHSFGDQYHRERETDKNVQLHEKRERIRESWYNEGYSKMVCNSTPGYHGQRQ
jgi:hypothetical protein